MSKTDECHMLAISQPDQIRSKDLSRSKCVFGERLTGIYHICMFVCVETHLSTYT